MSFHAAIPLLFISICTFIANDLDDVEKDKVNHPDRPLPAGHFSPAFATILYFTSLALALFLTRYYASTGVEFIYYGAIALAISYNYIVEYLPLFKAPYVAVAAGVPILIVAASYPQEAKLYVVAGSVVLLTLGREMCMDIRDRAGDKVSFLHGFHPTSLAGFAFFLQMTGTISLVFLINKVIDIIDLLVMIFLLVLAAICWFKFESYKLSLILMKIELFVGLYFLL